MLNRQFDNVITLELKTQKRKFFDGYNRTQEIPRSIFWVLLRGIFLGKIPKKKVFKYPHIVNQTIIINSPFHLELISDRLLNNNRIVLFLHSAPNCIENDGSYFGKNRALRLSKMKYINCIVTLSREYINPISRFLDFPKVNITSVFHAVDLVVGKPHKTQFYKIVTICRLDNKSKRLDLFIEVAKALPDYSFEIYGDGPDRQLVKDLSSCVSNVKIMGVTNNVSSVLNKADIFLLTSDYEGFGIANIEALSQGVPVVIANDTFPMARIIVQDGFNGYVCDEFSVEGTINKIKLIEKSYTMFSSNAIISSKRFSANKFKEQWLEIFKNVEDMELN